MWRTYAGTFTPKRKSSASVHLSRAERNERPSSAQQQKHWPNEAETVAARRNSSSITSSLEELIQREEQQQQKQKEQRRQNQSGKADGTETAAEGQAEKEAEEEEFVVPSRSADYSPHRSPNSVFIDPTGPSISGCSAHSQQQRISSPALFVARKHFQQQQANSKNGINHLAVPSSADVKSERKESAESADEERVQTPPLEALEQRSKSMPPGMDANGSATSEGAETEATKTNNQNAKPQRENNANGKEGKKTVANIFEKPETHCKSDRPSPTMATTDGIEYPRAASWSSSTVAEIMRDTIGRQVFRCFLHEALAEENLLFVEEVEKLKKEKQPEQIRHGVQMLLDKYGTYINLSSVAMSKLREATKAETPDPKCLDMAHKEIYKLLENDQFPRFRRSPLYLGFLEELLPRSYAERWTTSFDALLGNQVGRHHFRQFLFNVHAEENLRFWESVIEFRQLKNKSTAMQNMGRTIQQQFLREGAHNEVFLPFGLRQRVEKRIREKDVDETLFDEAVKHVEQILKNDPYVRFLQSKEYNDLLAKLH